MLIMQFKQFKQHYVIIAGLIFISSIFTDIAFSDDSEKQALTIDLSTFFRAARKVISDNQSLINDATKGDKGLSGEVVIYQAKQNYQSATKSEFAEPDDTQGGRCRKAILEAVDEVMIQAQPLINEQGKGFKGFLPAVFAAKVAEIFSKKMTNTAFIKLTAPKNYVRNRKNRPDTWEHNVLESKFKKANWSKGQSFSERGTHKGRPGFRFILPEYYGQSCLACHGQPKGERDITGGKKEGGVLGELGGGISVVIYD